MAYGTVVPNDTIAFLLGLVSWAELGWAGLGMLCVGGTPCAGCTLCAQPPAWGSRHPPLGTLVPPL